MCVLSSQQPAAVAGQLARLHLLHDGKVLEEGVLRPKIFDLHMPAAEPHSPTSTHEDPVTQLEKARRPSSARRVPSVLKRVPRVLKLSAQSTQAECPEYAQPGRPAEKSPTAQQRRTFFLSEAE